MRLLALSWFLSTACLRAEVTFNLRFEAGSKWFTEPWSAAARTEMEAFFTDLGKLFSSNAEVLIEINDDEQSAYASAGASWTTPVPVAGFDGNFLAPSLWSIIVKGVDVNGPGADAKINWNLDVNSLYGGNSGRMIGNIRGLARHEMHHAFGSSSGLRHSTSFDMRGSHALPRLVDSLYRDLHDRPLIGAYDPVRGLHVVNHFSLADDWTTTRSQSGLYFAARDRNGRLVKMPPINSSTSIDFSHITGISYVGDHPSWSRYEDTDLNFLRAMGYPLAEDATRSGSLEAKNFRLAGGNAIITVFTRPDHTYRVATSTDLKHWNTSPTGIPGTGGFLDLSSPADPESDPVLFFRVIESP